jgi:hypothetical protein
MKSHQLCSHSRTSQHFMEPEGSSLCSQEPSTGPYHEPDRSSHLTDDGETVSLTRQPTFTPREDSLYSFLLEAESNPGP